MRYADGTFDRAVEKREDFIWIDGQLSQLSSKIYPLWRHRYFFDDDFKVVSLLPKSAEKVARLGEAVLLGIDGETSHFILDVSHVSENLLVETIHGLSHDFRDVAMNLPNKLAAMLAFGRGLSIWHANYQYCGRCGYLTKMERAGHARRCTNEGCSRLHFPRTDPAVITLVIDGERCLLARRSTISIPRFSTVAGFVEPGETLGDAVRREVFEEVGVKTGKVIYRTSQPWPFPSSLMMGYWAKALNVDINVDGTEISEAAWFTREDINRDVADGAIILPPEDSISRVLVDDWRALPAGYEIHGLI